MLSTPISAAGCIWKSKWNTAHESIPHSLTDMTCMLRWTSAKLSIVRMSSSRTTQRSWTSRNQGVMRTFSATQWIDTRGKKQTSRMHDWSSRQSTLIDSPSASWISPMVSTSFSEPHIRRPLWPSWSRGTVCRRPRQAGCGTSGRTRGSTRERRYHDRGTAEATPESVRGVTASRILLGGRNQGNSLTALLDTV